jgi:molybdopterin synthase sulfur carrier subunit
MPVRVRLFAALREAAGTGEDSVDPGPLPAVLDVLRARYGDAFARRLAASSVLLDGSSVPRDAAVDVPDGAELALLPPVSGGGGP